MLLEDESTFALIFKLKEEKMAIKEFVLKEEPVIEETLQPKPKRKNTVRYVVEECDETAFVIRRETSRGSKHLVVIPTADQAYIKDGGDIDRLTADNYTRFMADAEDSISLPECIWIDHLQKGKVFGSALVSFLINHKDTVKYGVCYFDFAHDRFKPNTRNDLEVIVEDYGSLVKWITDYYTKNLFGGDKSATARRINKCVYLPSGQDAYRLLHAYFGEDNLKKLLSEAFERGVPLSGLNGWHIWELVTELYRTDTEFTQYVLRENEHRGYHQYGRSCYSAFESRDSVRFLESKRKNTAEKFDFRAWTEYLFSFEREGYANLGNFIRDWTDSLFMQNLVFGKIREKYPENLASYHNRLTLKYNIMKNEIDEKRLATYAEKNARYAWSGDGYLIKVPSSAEELVEEAIQQNNCLRSYIPRVADGETKIFFLRKKDNPDISHVTVQVTNDGRIVQARRYANRSISESERHCLCKWANARNLTMAI